MPADDLTDPAPATTFAHLDATTVLIRQIAEQGIYPAVDPLESTSRILEAGRRGARSTTAWPAGCRRFCSSTTNCRISLPFWAWMNWARRTSQVVLRARRIQRFLSQPFHVAEKFTGIPGRYVPR